MKSKGPKTEPWGIPQEESEKQLPILMACRLSVRHQVNQFRAMSDIENVADNGVESGGQVKQGRSTFPIINVNVYVIV